MDWQRFSRLISLLCDDPGTNPQLDVQQRAPLSECAEFFRQLLNVSARRLEDRKSALCKQLNDRFRFASPIVAKRMCVCGRMRNAIPAGRHVADTRVGMFTHTHTHFSFP